MLAFTLQSTQLLPRDMQWRRNAQQNLPTWNVVIEELGQEACEKQIPDSDYKPSKHRLSTLPTYSPISRRLRRPLRSQGDTLTAPRLRSTPDTSDEGEDNSAASPTSSNIFTRDIRWKQAPGASETSHPVSKPARGGRKKATIRSHAQRNFGPFCTSLCLQGLLKQEPLDQSCPNAQHHGTDRHRINVADFERRLRELLHDQVQFCEELYVNGATGVLYRIRLPQLGYTCE